MEIGIIFFLCAVVISNGVSARRSTPAFTVCQTAYVDVHNASTIPFNKVISFSGLAHSPSGIFTVPVKGVYKFQVYALTRSDSAVWLELYKNNVFMSSVYGYTSGDYADTGNTVLLQLKAGDKVRIVSHDQYDTAIYGTASDIYTTFSGVYIGNTGPVQSGGVLAFSTALDHHQFVQAGSNVVYNKVILDYQNAYNTINGVFTAPSAGIYIFHFFALSRRNTVLWQELYRNDDYICAIYGIADNANADAGNTAILLLNVGDHITLRASIYQNNSLYGAVDEVYSSFSGAMLYSNSDIAAGSIPTAFSVSISNNQTVRGGAKVIFDKVVTNVGNAYDNITGNFVAPRPGVYEVNYHALGQITQTIWLELYVNNRYIDALYSHTPIYYAAGGNSAVLILSAGDQVYVQAHGDNMLYGALDDIYCTFSGYLVYPTDGTSGGIIGK